MPRKKPIVVDSSGDTVKCYTVREAAKKLGMTLTEFKLILFKHKHLPYYRLMGKAKKRKIIRITDAHLQEFMKTRDMFDTIAEKVKIARKEFLVLKPMTQKEFGKETRIDERRLTNIERKRERISLVALDRVAKATGRDLEWFLSR